MAGDTDLTWTRLTLWRALLATALDAPPHETVTSAVVAGETVSPSTDLLAGWLAARLDAKVKRSPAKRGEGMVSVRLERRSGTVELIRPDGKVVGVVFGAALDAHAQAGRPVGCARTELAYGEFLRRARRRVEAREHLRAALEGFETLQAAPWAERAHIELRASGQTARRRDPSTRDRLTAQELQIAGFVAQGLTNREVAAQLFLSPRTIDFHLRNVFRKLDIASRTQLAHLDLDARAPDPATPPVPV